jgi:hypothetical protein
MASKFKRARYSPPTVHDRRAQDAPSNMLVGTVTVDDPYGSAFDKIVVFRNLRDDPLAAMHDAGQIGQHQFIAGRHWQKCYELSEMGGARAIDPTKEAVDGGRIPEPLSDAKCRALGDLAKARQALGLEGGAIIMDVLGRHMTIALCCDARGLTSERERNYLGRRFRECLDTLAIEFGYASPPRR